MWIGIWLVKSHWKIIVSKIMVYKVVYEKSGIYEVYEKSHIKLYSDLFFAVNSFKCTNFNKKIQTTNISPHSWSCEEEPQKTATTTAMSKDKTFIAAAITIMTGHSGSHGCTDGCSRPSNNAGLSSCSQGWGGGYLAGHASHNTAQILQKLNN